MKEEIFVPIDGCPGFFISNHGRVRKGIEKIVKTVTSQKGYIVLQVRMGGMSKSFSVHRLVAKHFIGDIDGLEINHKDFNKANNYFENLEIVTRAKNMEHFHKSDMAKSVYLKISKTKTNVPNPRINNPIILGYLPIVSSLLAIARANGLPTLKALADKAGMKRPQLSRYVSGKDSPSLENFLRLCEAAGAKIEIR